MHGAAIVLMLVALALVSSGTGRATDCVPCAFGGLCFVGDASVPCSPAEAGCLPTGGLLLFDSRPPNPPAYWTLSASDQAMTIGRLVGRLTVWADRSGPLPALPGFPGRCDDDMCVGQTGRFRGTIVGDRFTGVARYRRRAKCEFSGTIAFGLGGAEPNTFTCRDGRGVVMSEGGFRVQGIRLLGCKR